MTRRLAIGTLALLVFSIPFESGVSIAGVGSVSRLIGILAMGMGVVSLFEGSRVRFRAPSLFLLLAAAFVAWGAVSYFWSLVPPVSLARTFQFVQLLLFAWLIHQLCRTERDRDLLMQAFVLGCLSMVGVAVAMYFGAARVDYRDVAFSTNEFAAVAALAIPMAWGLMLRRAYPALQLVNTLYPLVALAGVVLAASRGGLLTALVGLVIVPLALRHVGLVRRVVLSLGVAAVAFASFMWFPQAVPDLERNLERLGAVEEELVGGTMTGRTDIWMAGLQVFHDSPVLGVGVGTYAYAVEPVLGRFRGAHNAFWSVAVTTGVIGALLFFAMFAVVLVGLTASRPRRVDALVLFAALLVSVLPLNVENNKFVWFTLAVLASVRPVMIRVGYGIEQASISRNRAPTSSDSRRPSAAAE